MAIRIFNNLPPYIKDIVMCGKQLINIWLAFRILGLEMNFDNFISVTCILCWHIGNFKFAFRYENG